MEGNSERYFHTCARASESDSSDLIPILILLQMLELAFCIRSSLLLLAAIIRFIYCLTHWRGEISRKQFQKQ